ncbi:hypothetical protein DH2020_034493 [Rehmannia glutinosa]|uniref:Retrotransposon Copia-like N-terminal domain-containing protein n=1 Tax=Rehmannia glutinosa TaxID=99300 RepID=A0ABR0VCF7_REHGL
MADSGQSTASMNNSNFNLVFPQNQLISIKLDDTNFLIWKQMILTAIRGYGLEHLLLKDVVAPEQYTVDATTKKKELNTEFMAWQRQDQLLASWILSSLSESILILMVGLSSSSEIWNAIDTHFSSQSNAKVMEYKLKLSTLKKENIPMREYLNKIKHCFDLLAAAGKKLSEEDQIMHVLTGLGSDYNALMVSVTSRFEPLSMVELQALLMSYEARLESIAAPLINTEGSIPSINTITQKRFSNNQTGPSNFNRNRMTQFRGGRGGRNNYRGRGGRFGAGRIQCQVCGISGHSADKCWHRFDSSYNGAAPNYTEVITLQNFVLSLPKSLLCKLLFCRDPFA